MVRRIEGGLDLLLALDSHQIAGTKIELPGGCRALLQLSGDEGVLTAAVDQECLRKPPLAEALPQVEELDDQAADDLPRRSSSAGP